MRKIILCGASLIIGLVIGGATLRTGTTQTQQCQYPERPLVNGECDNSDPCDPSTTKDPVLHGDCADKPKPTPQPEPQPVVTKPNVEPAPSPKCQ